MPRVPASGRQKSLGETIKMGREVAGLSIRQLAAEVGIHHSYLSRIESGDVDRPAAELLQRLAIRLRLNPAHLLAFVGVRRNPAPGLPPIRTYFRRKLGVNAGEAEVLAQLVENYQADHKGEQHHGSTNQGDADQG